MSQTIEVPDPLFEEVREDAEAQGLSLVGWIASKLPSRRRVAAASSLDAPRSMADRLAGRLGRVGSGSGTPSSDDVGQSFAEHLEAKQRDGRL